MGPVDVEGGFGVLEAELVGAEGVDAVVGAAGAEVVAVEGVAVGVVFELEAVGELAVFGVGAVVAGIEVEAELAGGA